MKDLFQTTRKVYHAKYLYDQNALKKIREKIAKIYQIMPQIDGKLDHLNPLVEILYQAVSKRSEALLGIENLMPTIFPYENAAHNSIHILLCRANYKTKEDFKFALESIFSNIDIIDKDIIDIHQFDAACIKVQTALISFEQYKILMHLKNFNFATFDSNALNIDIKKREGFYNYYLNIKSTEDYNKLSINLPALQPNNNDQDQQSNKIDSYQIIKICCGSLLMIGSGIFGFVSSAILLTIPVLAPMSVSLIVGISLVANGVYNISSADPYPLLPDNLLPDNLLPDNLLPDNLLNADPADMNPIGAGQ